MPQELRAQPCTFACSLNEPWDVGNHKADLVRWLADRYHAEVRLQRCERIIRDLGTRCRNARDQRALAGVGIADQPDVSQQLQLQPQHALLAGMPLFVLTRGLVRGSSEASIATPAASAARHHDALIGSREI